MSRAARECPACGHGFVHRRAKHCRKCYVWLLMPGERWHPAGGKRAFMWMPELSTWIEVTRRA